MCDDKFWVEHKQHLKFAAIWKVKADAILEGSQKTPEELGDFYRDTMDKVEFHLEKASECLQRVESKRS